MGDYIGSKDGLGRSACTSCDKSYCCEYQHEIGIASTEFDEIEHLVTDVHIDRAKKVIAKPQHLNGLETYRCPFLSDDGLCEIYENRFMVCAMYSVVGSNFSCSPANNGGSVPMVNITNVIEAAMKNEDVYKRLYRHVPAKDVEPSDVLEEFKRRYKL